MSAETAHLATRGDVSLVKDVVSVSVDLVPPVPEALSTPDALRDASGILGYPRSTVIQSIEDATVQIGDTRVPASRVILASEVVWQTEFGDPPYERSSWPYELRMERNSQNRVDTRRDVTHAAKHLMFWWTGRNY